MPIRIITFAALPALLGTLCPTPLHADITNWQTDQTIPGTESITPGPGIDVSSWNTDEHNLQYADFSGGLNLSNSFFYSSWLDNSRFRQANLAGAGFAQARLTNADLSQANLVRAEFDFAALTNADLSDAMVKGASFYDTHGFTKEQLYSTASYKVKDLEGIGLRENDLSGWNFVGQNLTGGTLSGTLTNADLSDAVVKSARLVGITKEQLYSTASYKVGDLAGINLAGNDLSRWNFAGQNLAGANFFFSTLTNADVSNAFVREASFFHTGFTKEQLYSTASYKVKDLEGIGLGENDLLGWNFAGQNLAGAYFDNARLTDADLSDATVKGANFDSSLGFTKEQLYSTSSYQAKDLERIVLRHNDLSDWNFAGQNIDGVYFGDARLTNADLRDAVVKGASFWNSLGFTKEQLYSTASYKAKDLERIVLGHNDLSDWNFAGQNLAGAAFFGATLTNANLSGANLKNASLDNSVGLDAAIFSAETSYNQWTVFPSNFNPVASGLTFMASPAGDFDANDILDVSDVDLLITSIRQRDFSPIFKLNGDSVVDDKDLRIWVKDLKHTWFGDANLDGEFNSGDLVNVFQSGQYEDARDGNSSWATGDWNADGEFTTTDWVVAFQDGGYEAGPRVAAAAVPEPGTIVLALLGITSLILRRTVR